MAAKRAGHALAQVASYRQKKMVDSECRASAGKQCWVARHASSTQVLEIGRLWHLYSSVNSTTNRDSERSQTVASWDEQTDGIIYNCYNSGRMNKVRLQGRVKRNETNGAVGVVVGRKDRIAKRSSGVRKRRAAGDRRVKHAGPPSPTQEQQEAACSDRRLFVLLALQAMRMAELPRTQRLRNNELQCCKLAC